MGEIRKGVEQIRDQHKKEKLRLGLEIDLPQWFGERILTIDQFVADRWGRLQAEMKKNIPAIDSLIAAADLHYNLRLVTGNVSDFDFPFLQVINPWQTS